MRLDTQVAALALRQDDVFSLAQLQALGLKARAVQMRASRGRLHRVYRAVYSLAPPALLKPKGRYRAAVLACGPGAVLSHRSAADLHDLRRTTRARIDVTVPGRRQHRIAGIDVHCSLTLSPEEITYIDGIPCTTIARTMFDLASVVPRRDVERAFDQAEVLESLHLPKLEAVIERNRNTKAASVVGSILASYRAGAPTESELEERLLEALRAADVPAPSRQVYINPGDGEPPIRADFVWRRQKLVVETDGHRHHRTRRAFESDRRRDQRLTVAGWRVIRITWRQLDEEPERVTALIVAALRLP